MPNQGDNMDSLPYILMIFIFGIVVGSCVTAKALAYYTRKKRHARENALRKIVHYQWNNGTHNDAIPITRIALSGLKGEE